MSKDREKNPAYEQDRHGAQPGMVDVLAVRPGVPDVCVKPNHGARRLRVNGHKLPTKLGMLPPNRRCR